MTDGVRATLRTYCQGIGDCHLLKFPKQDGGDFWMLIDCGIHTSISGGKETVNRIVDDIASQTKHLDVIVGTHEHWDHISGFFTAAEKFKSFTVGAVWLAWTENPDDAQGRALDQYKGEGLRALQAAQSRLNAPGFAVTPYLDAVRTGVESLLQFNFGIKGERVRDARNALVGLAPGKRPCYLEPSTPPLSLANVPNVRIFVLGPPRDSAMLGIRERPDEQYGVAGVPLASALTSSLLSASQGATPEEDQASPFDPGVGESLSGMLKGSSSPGSALGSLLQSHYAGPADIVTVTDRKGRTQAINSADQSWRRVDGDWLGVSAELALQMDNRTNNSSLVLAIEFIDTGAVLLFAADAQAGNWLSWQGVSWKLGDQSVRGPDLLARTVFYKVGHHGSHNATLARKGLELMKSPDLAAFIPVRAADAQKVKWGNMPLPELVTALKSATQGRLIRADDDWVGTQATTPAFAVPSGCIAGLRHQQNLWVELDFR
jgi:hypothetical protein